jgi:TetR/AcrR family transcriptional regulator
MSRKENPASRQRNTRERIRRAAVKEFSARGFAGARVERIARTAKVNIRMIYYFFDSKRGLLDDVLSEIFYRRKAWLGSDFDNIVDLLMTYFEGYAGDPESVRLLLWEALETPSEKASLLSNFADRQEIVGQRIASLATMQKAGKVPARLDPRLLYLMLLALAIYPQTFPQTVFIATGLQSSSENFKKKYRTFLREVGRLILQAGNHADA